MKKVLNRLFKRKRQAKLITKTRYKKIIFDFMDDMCNEELQELIKLEKKYGWNYVIRTHESEFEIPETFKLEDKGRYVLKECLVFTKEYKEYE